MAETYSGADPYNPGMLPRTYFRAPRVPFDVRALLLAVLGYLVWWAGDLLLSGIAGRESLSGAFLYLAADLFDEVPFLGQEIVRLVQKVFRVDFLDARGSQYTFWLRLIGGAWFVGVWSFFALGICRVTALRIARDESLTLTEALKFSLRNWTTLLFVPLLVVGVLLVFALCNAAGGLVMSIPFVGSVLSLVILPLVAISTLVMLLVALGGIAGFPLVGAAAAWECNGSLDAMSRAFSYVFARPLQYFWSFFLIFLFTGVILLVGTWFVYTAVETVDFGVVSDDLEILTAAPAPDNKSEQWTGYDNETRQTVAELEESTGYRAGREAPDIQPFARDLRALGSASWAHKLSAIVWWVVLNLAWLGFFGYATYYFLGASTCLYADLRADVDGTEEDEIYLEDEEKDLDALAEGAASEGAEGSAGTGDPESNQGATAGPPDAEPASSEESGESEPT